MVSIISVFDKHIDFIKMQYDMITHHIKWGILTSFNSGIQGMKELDFHTFLRLKIGMLARLNSLKI